MIWKGFALSLCAAVCQTTIDGLRKKASNDIDASNLVCLGAVIEALLSCSFVATTGGFSNIHIKQPHVLTAAVVVSSAILLFSKWMYQQALTVSQISLTVPYLSFTPTFLIVTGFFFLGETPSVYGLLGVAIVTMGGFLLSRSAKSNGAQSPSATPEKKEAKPKASFLPLTLPVFHKRHGSVGSGSSSSSSHTHSNSPSFAVFTNSKLINNDTSLATSTGASRTSIDRANSKQVLHSSNSGSLGNGIHDAGVYRTAKDTGVVSLLPAASINGTLAARSVFRNTAAAAEVDHSEPATPVFAINVPRVASFSTMLNMTTTGFPKVTDKDKPDKELQSKPSTSKPSSAHFNQQNSSSGMGMMLLVAVMWSVTASLDKIGLLHSPTVWVYFALQRLAMGTACSVYLAVRSPQVFKILASKHLQILVIISICELVSMVFFLEAMRYLFVSYVVAIKRSNILLSVLIAGLLFKEKIASRLPYISFMLLGMSLIALDPQSSSVHD